MDFADVSLQRVVFSLDVSSCRRRKYLPKACADQAIFEAIKKHEVTHFCGAPVVLNTLINAGHEIKSGIDHKVFAMTAGAAPPAA